MRKLAVYLAGDNDLSEFGVRDILEMERIGSSSSLQVWVQADFLGTGNTVQYLVQKSAQPNANEIQSPNLAPDGFEVNTGDPNEFSKFLIWALGGNIGEQSSLILWGHGTGWRPTSGKSPNVMPSLFNHQTILEELGIHLEEGKAFGADYTDAHAALDVLQLDRRFNIFRGGGPKFDFIGFDACLMASIEVSYQLLPHCDFLVVSASEEPPEGWPYQRVIEILSSKQQPISQCLKEIAKAYVRSYLPEKGGQIANKPVTLSIINLRTIPDLVKSVSSFAKLAIDLLTTNNQRYYNIFSKAKNRAQVFTLNSYIDLASFMWKIEERLLPEQEPDDRRLAREINRVLIAIQNSVYKQSIDDHPVHELDRHGGLTIYFPPRAYKKNNILRIAYEKLELYKIMPEWWDFILKFHE